MSDAIVLDATPLVNALRVLSRQPELPRPIEGRTGREHVPGFEPPSELPDLGAESWVRKYIAESAARWKTLTDASNCVTNGKVPVHGELVNDAAEAIIRSNFRSSMIFSAMAVESCAGTILDRDYARILNQTPPSKSHRFVTIQASRDEWVTKDDVYLSLRASGGEGGHLVHQYAFLDDL